MALLKIARARGKLPNGKVVDRKLYERWCLIRRRCYDPAFIVYPIYGGAGITVCAEWITDYLAFQKGFGKRMEARSYDRPNRL